METRNKGRLWQNIISAFFYITALSCITAIVVACVTTPETNRKQLNFIPDAQMAAMGLQAYDEMLKKEKVSSNKAQTEAIVRVGKAIAAASGKAYDWDFTLFDEPKTVNAFCLPGGKVGVYTGILSVADNEAGLAAILGHEVAHAVLRHGAERASQTIVLQAGVSLASLSFSDPRYRQAVAGAMGIGLQYGVLLPYGRKHESEADTVGLKYMAIAGYDPKEAVKLWERMAKVGGSRPPEILSTHPDPEKRAKVLEDEIPDVMDYYRKSSQKPSAKIPG